MLKEAEKLADTKLTLASSVIDDQNWKFESCCRHPIAEWVGSRAMLDAWLLEKDNKEPTEEDQREG